ncbi:MAG TPA: DUF5995 family protein [Aeromicrobium sp.]|nr:DUF5995 family protein [Aeromicrobium sp.]
MVARFWLSVGAVALSVGSVVGSLSAPAAAVETPWPLTSDLINPKPLDPAIALLLALPTPYTPYTGDICPGGEDECIDEVISEMEDRLEPLAESCSHHAIFSLAYLRVTENVRDANRSGYFADREWLNTLDTIFADMYFRTMDDYEDGEPVPPAWKVALDTTENRELNGLGNFMMNMNAHINNDFPRALAEVGLTAEDGTSHKPDHNAYNQRLDSLYRPVFIEESQRFDPAFDQFHVGPVEGTVAGVIMRGWREGVWRNAELVAKAKTPAQQQLVSQWINNYALVQAQLIRSLPVFQATDASNARRDAWCAEHHG